MKSYILILFAILSLTLASAQTTITDSEITTSGNLTLGEKITFSLGGVLSNLVNGWIKITGGLNVTENIVSQNNITAEYLKGSGALLTDVNLSQNNIVIVSEESDLPASSGGKIQLNDNTIYYFNSFVTSTSTLVLANNSPLIGNHGGADGFIHLGTSNAIEGTNANLLMRNLYVHAPGGTIFNLTADNTTEMLVESTAFSDAAGLGNIASLGIIDGYRVPTFKGANFENFNQGLTFKGNPDKIFIASSPFRTVGKSNVVILNFSSDLNVDIVDIVNCYFKQLKNDTIVVHGANSSLPSGIFQYRGNTHDADVNISLILTGEITPTSKGVKVIGSYPIRDSSVGGKITSNETNLIEGSGTSFTKINSTTQLYDDERVRMPENSTLSYNSKFNSESVVYSTIKVRGASTDNFRVRFSLNGNTAQRSEISGSLFNSNSYATLTLVDKMKLEEGDNITVEIKNEDGTADLTVEDFLIAI